MTIWANFSFIQILREKAIKDLMDVLVECEPRTNTAQITKLFYCLTGPFPLATGQLNADQTLKMVSVRVLICRSTPLDNLYSYQMASDKEVSYSDPGLLLQ